MSVVAIIVKSAKIPVKDAVNIGWRYSPDRCPPP
jgi:hypothetical protein